MIPKIIHYCWFGPKPFPKLVKRCLETWHKHLPDYELKLWNESNSPMDVTFVKEAYAARKYAFVSDYIRFWALYNHGGIYLDTDMFVTKSFDGFLHNHCFFGWETKEMKIISCGVIGCSREVDFISEILDSYNNVKFNLNDKNSIIVTRHISKCYKKYIHKDKIKIYSYDYFYPFPFEQKENLSNFLKYSTEHTHAVHLWNISWGSARAKIQDKLLYHIKRFIKKP